MTTNENDPPSAFDKATDTVRGATEAVQLTTQSIAAAIGESRQANGVLNKLTRLVREAPIRSLVIAFLFGFMFARRQ